MSSTSTPHARTAATAATLSSVDVEVPATMRAIVARTYGRPTQVMVSENLSTPAPEEGQMLLRVHASSLNPLDWHFVTGTPYMLRAMNGLRSPKRVVHGADIAGTVVALGPGVDGFAIGDRVFGESGGGGLAEYSAVRATSVAPIPDGVSFEAAAATPVAGLTALQGLSTHARVAAGERVLVNGAAGGVGTFAVQIAKALGADVTGVCSTRNVAMVRSIGADTVVDYTTDDFVAMVAGGALDRFDVVLDNVGNRSPREILSVLGSGGRYAAVSGPKDNPWLDPMRHIAKSMLAFRRAEQTFHQFTARPNTEDLVRLGELLADGRLVPQVDRTIGLDAAEVIAGLAEIGTGHTPAKIVVRVCPS